MIAPAAASLRRTPRRRLLLAIPAAALCAIAGLSFHGAFDLGDIAILCAVAAVLPAGTIIALARLRTSTDRGLTVRIPDVIVGAVIGWLVVVPLVAIWQEHVHGGGSTSPASFLDILRTSLTDGARQLLTTAPPAPPTAVLLATVATLVWWASVWTTTAMLRGATPLAPLIPPTVLLGLGTAASVAAGGPGAIATAAGWVVTALGYLTLEQAVREQPADTVVSGGGRGNRWGAGAAVAPTIGVVTACALVAVYAASHLPGLAQRAPWDPRSVVSPPAVASDSTDPLTQAVAWLKSGTSARLFTVDTTAPDQSLRWAVLDGYDGRHWSSSARYEPAGKKLPPGDAVDAPPGPSVVVHDSVRLDGMPGPFLPAPGRARGVSGSAVRVDPRLGLIATVDGRPAGTLGYTVDATVPVLDVSRLEAATPGGGGALDAFRTLPAGLPDDVAELPGTVSAADPYEQLKALASAVHDAFGYDPDAAAGQSYGRLNGLLAYGKDSATPSAASADAFATLFAVAARQSGFPSRVVVGFVPGQQISPHTYAVTGADVRVWPEVYFTGVGWVPFADAVPGGTGTPSAGSAPVEAQPTEVPTSAVDTSAASATSSGPQPGIDLPDAGPGSSPLVVLLVVLGAVAVLAVVAFAGFSALAVMLRRRERAARRRDPDPRNRTQWAWLDGLDALAIGADSVLTPTELRAAAPELAGEDGAVPLRKLAGLAELAAFAAEAPESAAADEAWEYAEQIRVLVRRRTPRRTRAARAFRSGAVAVGARARPGRRH